VFCSISYSTTYGEHFSAVITIYGKIMTLL
jgi:hypothetical protein